MAVKLTMELIFVVLLASGGQLSAEGDLEGVQGGFPSVGPALLALAGGVQARDREVDALECGGSRIRTLEGIGRRIRDPLSFGIRR
jgi:hypothetical protein